MSRLDERVDRPFVVEVASLVEASHEPRPDGTPRRCLHCTPDGCQSLVWALPILTDHRRRRAELCSR